MMKNFLRTSKGQWKKRKQLVSDEKNSSKDENLSKRGTTAKLVSRVGEGQKYQTQLRARVKKGRAK